VDDWWNVIARDHFGMDQSLFNVFRLRIRLGLTQGKPGDALPTQVAA